MAAKIHRGQIERITIEKEAALKDAKLVILVEENEGPTGGFTKLTFSMPDDRALRNLKDDIDGELNRRREERMKKPETP